jgi:hypothetical protein
MKKRHDFNLKNKTFLMRRPFSDEGADEKLGFFSVALHVQYLHLSGT